MKLLKLLKGKKTYAVALLGFVLGGLEALSALGYGAFSVPNEVYIVLGFLGLGAIRDAIKK